MFTKLQLYFRFTARPWRFIGNKVPVLRNLCTLNLYFTHRSSLHVFVFCFQCPIGILLYAIAHTV